MPNPASPGVRNVDMSAAPGSDLSFDDLFPIEDGNQPAPQAADPGANPPVAEPQAPAPVVAPAEPQFFLKAGKSVYMSAEEAARGVEQKDSAIEQLRQYAIERTGFDPLTQKPVSQTPQAPPNYMQDGKRYYQDLVAAVAKNDEEAYAHVQAKFLQDAFAPVAPLIADVARQKAIRQVNAEIPDFGKFVDTKDYSEILDQMPMLKQAITVGESDPYQAANLSELYKIAFFAGQGRRLQAAPPQPVVQTPPAARPTTTNSTMTPPAPSAPPDLRTSEGRKALIRDAESRGILDKSF